MDGMKFGGFWIEYSELSNFFLSLGLFRWCPYSRSWSLPKSFTLSPNEHIFEFIKKNFVAAKKDLKSRQDVKKFILPQMGCDFIKLELTN
jgi:hypothetical protein